MKDSLDILSNYESNSSYPKRDCVCHDSLDILRTDDVIEHHGILGMHWGIRRFQPYGKGYNGDGKFVGTIKKKIRDVRDKKYRDYDISYSKAGSASGTRSKYTNIDGSLNEKGRFHSQSYISKQIKKNEKYYDKVINKYNKRAEEYKDEPEMRDKFLQLAKEAEKTKNAVNASIKKMDIDSVMRNESIDHENAMKAIKTAAGVTVGAAGGSLLVGGALGLSNAMKKNPEVRQAVKQFDIHEPVDSAIDIVNSTSIGKKGYDAMETALKTYFDARAYVIAIGLNQANTRLQKADVYKNFGESIGSSLKTAGETSGYTPEVVQKISGNLKDSSANIAKISNSEAATQFINSGHETVTQALNNPNVASTLSNLNSINNADISAAVENELKKRRPAYA